MGKRTGAPEKTLESFNAELTEVLKSGKYVLGADCAMKAILADEAKVIIITRKAPPKIKCDFEYYTMLGKIGLLRYPGETIELRKSDGEQFRVSVLGVTDLGNSNIMELISSSSVEDT